MSRNRSLGSLHLEGFEEIQTGHWTLRNDGHSGTNRLGSPRPLNASHFWINVVFSSHPPGGERHVGERRRPPRCLPHHPAALPLGRPRHQRLGAHAGPTQIPDGGRVRPIGGPPCLAGQLRHGASLTSCLCPDARRQHESRPPEFHRCFRGPDRARRSRNLYWCE